ncbi:hypothetical protein PpBr36_00715 [Pyricularia pennisetigena]|uniref:hypothetical protein n=1 Tax=Pyricularia pennisetigena TaxID=1578925 RepID=UPI00114FAF9E|nr:hypothetical protein PpBr36_00715 [Pyricularia pennisetigena]TLS29059.1 hypothetical protein PpBr36_00715 [Pyricularia pennisetigena]
MVILGNPPRHPLHQQGPPPPPPPDHFETGGVRKRQRLSHFASADDAAPARFAPFAGGSIVDATTAGRLPLGESSGNTQPQNAQSFTQNREVMFGRISSNSSQNPLAHCSTTSTADNSTATTPTLTPLPTLESSHHHPAAAGAICGPSNPSAWTLDLADEQTRRTSLGARRGNSQHLHLDFANGQRRSLYGAPGGGPGALPPRKGTPTAGAPSVSYNPLYNNAAFRAYRAKQAEKAADGREEQKWPEWLEQAFCDALLTIPAMGRHKYQMMKRPAPNAEGGGGSNGNSCSTSNSNDQAGRNMLISEWLWLVYLETLPSIAAELPDRQWEMQVVNKKTGESQTKLMNHAMVRDRKMVSSHIQVTKNFFKDNPMQHFVFVTEEKRANGREEDEERESFKDNTVLRALRESRLPDKRYNYRYWSYLLAADKRVQIRPKECWILVAATSVNFVSTTSSARITSSSSSGHGESHCHNATGKTSPSFHAYHAKTGERLDEERFPHLEKNLKREDWPRSGANIKGCMLHEYTRAMTQVPSTSIRNLRKDWEEDFPELHEPLSIALADGVQDILHCKLALDISQATQFPAGAELNSCIEVSIDQPELVGHDWKVVTRLCRPQELCRDRGAGSDPFFSIETKPVGHDGNCDGVGLAAGGNCNCVAARHKNELMVPYPAAELAVMLSRLATYDPHPYVGFEPSPEELAAEAGRKKRGRKSNTGTGDDEADWSMSMMLNETKRAKAVHSQKKLHSITPSPAPRRPTPSTAGPQNEDGGGAYSKDGADAAGQDEPVSQMSLIGQVAMMQELWSQEPVSAATTPGQQRPWTRRCLLLWTFETLYSIDEKRLAAGHKYPINRQAAGSMSWRFMSAIDPSDPIHLQQSIIGGDEAAAQIAAVAQSMSANAAYTTSEPAILGSSPAPGVAGMIVPSSTPSSASRTTSRLGGGLHRDQIMSPSPSFQQHIHASMAENYASTSAWSGSGAGILSSNGHAYAANYHSHAPPPTQPTAAMHTPSSVTYGQRGGTPLFRGLMDDFRHGGSPGSGLATPPPTAGLASMVCSSAAPLSQHMSSGSIAPSMSFMSTASTVDGCAESVVDPFLTSGSFGSYQHEVVVPDGWEVVHAGPDYGLHDLTSGGWTVTPGGNVGGAGSAASSFNGNPCWASQIPHHGMPGQQPQQHHQHWNTPAASTPGSTVLELGSGAADYNQNDGCVSSQQQIQWRQQPQGVASSQPSPCHSPSPHGSQHATIGFSQTGGDISGGLDAGLAPGQQLHHEQRFLVAGTGSQISRKRALEDENQDDQGRCRVGATVSDASVCGNNHEDAWALIDA